MSFSNNFSLDNSKNRIKLHYLTIKLRILFVLLFTEKVEPAFRLQRGRVQRDDGFPGNDSVQLPRLPLEVDRQSRHLRYHLFLRCSFSRDNAEGRTNLHWQDQWVNPNFRHRRDHHQVWCPGARPTHHWAWLGPVRSGVSLHQDPGQRVPHRLLERQGHRASAGNKGLPQNGLAGRP